MIADKTAPVHNKISFYLLGLFVFFLPFDMFYSEILLIAFLPHTIIHAGRAEWKKINGLFLWLSSFYILCILGSFYPGDQEEAFKILGTRAGLFLFPLLFSITTLDLSRYRTAFLKIMIVSSVSVISYLFLFHLYTIIKNSLPLSSLFSNQFINHNFSAPAGLHATYLSLHAALAISCCFYYAGQATKKSTKTVYACCLFILFTGLLMLSSRAVLAATLFIIIILVPAMLLRQRSKWLFPLSIMLTLLVSLGFFFNHKDFKERYITALKEDLSKTSGGDKVETRLERWECAWELVKEAPWTGHGTGAEKTKLKEKYFEKKYYLSYINELNAHNQYLSILICFGITGLMVFMSILYLGISTALRKKDFIFTSFLTLIIITSASENILSVNKGVYFLGFFLSFFLFSNQLNNNENTSDISKTL